MPSLQFLSGLFPSPLRLRLYRIGMRKLLAILLDIDDPPPKRLGVAGVLILVAFTLFAVFVWFNHPTHLLTP